jgi:hypothetical protein
MQLFVPFDNPVVRVFFHASASMLRQTVYFLPLSEPTESPFIKQVHYYNKTRLISRAF